MTHQVKLISTAAVVAGGHVILVKYKGMPDHQSGWFLPHDLLQDLEHPTDGAKRALSEQLGIRFESPQLKHLESFRGRDKTWHMSFHHLCALPEKVELKRSDDLTDAQWFALDRLPAAAEVSHHGWAIQTLKEMGVIK